MHVRMDLQGVYEKKYNAFIRLLFNNMQPDDEKMFMHVSM